VADFGFCWLALSDIPDLMASLNYEPAQNNFIFPI
jgi:hypothetical protein